MGRSHVNRPVDRGKKEDNARGVQPTISLASPESRKRTRRRIKVRGTIAAKHRCRAKVNRSAENLRRGETAAAEARFSEIFTFQISPEALETRPVYYFRGNGLCIKVDIINRGKWLTLRICQCYQLGINLVDSSPVRLQEKRP